MDDTEGEDDPAKMQLVEERLAGGRRVTGYCLRDTWTKGGRKGFFTYVYQGEILEITAARNGWAEVAFRDGVGLMRLTDVRLILDYE